MRDAALTTPGLCTQVHYVVHVVHDISLQSDNPIHGKYRGQGLNSDEMTWSTASLYVVTAMANAGRFF